MSAVAAWANWLAWTGVVAWIYWLTVRVQHLQDRLEAAAGALERLLPLVPGKSAPRTVNEAPAAREPWTPFRGLTEPDPGRPSPAPRTDTVEQHAVVEVGIDRLLDHGAEQPTRGRHRG